MVYEESADIRVSNISVAVLADNEIREETLQ